MLLYKGFLTFIMPLSVVWFKRSQKSLSKNLHKPSLNVSASLSHIYNVLWSIYFSYVRGSCIVSPCLCASTCLILQPITPWFCIVLFYRPATKQQILSDSLMNTDKETTLWCRPKTEQKDDYSAR